MASEILDHRFETKLLVLYENEGEKTRLWELCFNSVLSGKDIAEVLLDKDVDRKAVSGYWQLYYQHLAMTHLDLLKTMKRRWRHAESYSLGI